MATYLHPETGERRWFERQIDPEINVLEIKPEGGFRVVRWTKIDLIETLTEEKPTASPPQS